jgi:hypothetical protein
MTIRIKGDVSHPLNLPSSYDHQSPPTRMYVQPKERVSDMTKLRLEDEANIRVGGIDWAEYAPDEGVVRSDLNGLTRVSHWERRSTDVSMQMMYL